MDPSYSMHIDDRYALICMAVVKVDGDRHSQKGGLTGPCFLPRRMGVAIAIDPFQVAYVYRGFLKWWYPTTMGFPTKNDHFEVFWGYHHLRKHPYTLYLVLICSLLWPVISAAQIVLRIFCSHRKVCSFFWWFGFFQGAQRMGCPDHMFCGGILLCSHHKGFWKIRPNLRLLGKKGMDLCFCWPCFCFWFGMWNMKFTTSRSFDTKVMGNPTLLKASQSYPREIRV